VEPIHPGLPGTVPVLWGVEHSVPVSHRICFGTLDPSYCDSIHCINFFLFVLSTFSSESVATSNLPNVKMECVVTVVSVCDNPDSVVQEQC